MKPITNVNKLANLHPRETRSLCARNLYNGPTAGASNGYIQANVVILPEKYAKDFIEFCKLNSKPCPILETLSPGQISTTKIAKSTDIRYDLPKYRYYYKENNQIKFKELNNKCIFINLTSKVHVSHQ